MAFSRGVLLAFLSVTIITTSTSAFAFVPTVKFAFVVRPMTNTSKAEMESPTSWALFLGSFDFSNTFEHCLLWFRHSYQQVYHHHSNVCPFFLYTFFVRLDKDHTLSFTRVHRWPYRSWWHLGQYTPFSGRLYRERRWIRQWTLGSSNPAKRRFLKHKVIR